MFMLDVDNLQVTSNMLPSGYLALTNIWNGKPNPEMSASDHERCEYAIRTQASDSHSDRLSNNYEANLRLADMFLYTVLWDPADRHSCTTVRRTNDGNRRL